ncbi:hypothetical protein FKK92_25345, partial [Klebsiella pneumoniae]|nr:hypothetical protein [Klebsiella pneumoniae]
MYYAELPVTTTARFSGGITIRPLSGQERTITITGILLLPVISGNRNQRHNYHSVIVPIYYQYGFVNGMVASHLLCHSGTINRHSLNGA